MFKTSAFDDDDDDKDKKNWERKNMFWSQGPICLIIINFRGHQNFKRVFAHNVK